MDVTKLTALRKGLLEFLILAIVSSGKVYVADILRRLSQTDFATQEGTLYPLLSKMRREELLDYEWQESATGPRASTTASQRREPASWPSSASTGPSSPLSLMNWETNMQKVVDISLNGHPDPFRLHEDAYELLNRYLDGARHASATIRTTRRSLATLSDRSARSSPRV